MKKDIVFDRDLIIVQAVISGKKNFNPYTVKMLLDTGSDKTILKPPYIEAIGYSEKDKKQDLVVGTGSGTDKAYELQIYDLECFGFNTQRFNVVVKDFPIALHFFDGILGLDFFQKTKTEFTLNFQENWIEVK